MQYTKLQKLCHQWHLTADGETLETATSLIVPVIHQGAACMLKLPKPDADEHDGANALEYYDGHGAVRVIRSNGQAALLERACPGHLLNTLCVSEGDEKSTEVFCQVASKLHEKALAPVGFKSVVEHWGDGFDDYLSTTNQQIPKNLVYHAKTLFEQLSSTQGKQILLHGDLHHENIVFDSHRGWLAIDPKGVIGEAEIEASAFLRNPIGHTEIFSDPAVINQRVAYIAQQLGMNSTRIIQWCAALTVLSCIWRIEIGEHSDEWLKLANTLLDLTAAP